MQPHGVLLVLEDGAGDGGTVDEGGLVVSRTSTSVGPLLGIAPERTIGRALGTLFGDAVADAVAAAARALDAADADENRVHVLELELDVRGARSRADATLHRAGEARVLEIDGLRPADAPAEAIAIGTLQRATRRLHAARDVETLSGTIAGEVRALVGFDRAMVYRFHPDGHVEVVAESVVPDLEPFPGPHRPESDVPARARESRVRCIPTVPHTPSAILPADAPPIDLAFSRLRSVSPVHVECLTDAGVGASMSISLLAGERPWGLVACHHREARHVGAATRAACELLGTTFSLLLPSLEATVEARADTTLRDLERRLLSQEDLRNFAHTAAHDLKEPLRGIANYAAFLREEHGDAFDADGRRMIATIVRLAERGGSLTTALLAFAEAGGDAGPGERFALERVVDGVRETFAPELARRGVAFRVVGPLPELVGDVHRMEQILTNLVGNALKYNDADEPWIEIAAEPHANRSGDWIGGEHLERRSHVVRVSDNGIGIPDARREDVFRPFERLHPRDAYGGGHGVGLAIVRRAVEIRGGRIAVESTPGAGTTFRFSCGEPLD